MAVWRNWWRSQSGVYRVDLAIGEPRVARRREIGLMRVPGAACRDEERTVGRLAALLQVGVEVARDAAGEEHLARPVTFAVDADAPLHPVNSINVDGQGLAAAQRAIIDQPEQGAIARVVDGTQPRLDLLRVQGAWFAPHLRPALHAHQGIAR